MRRAWLCTMLVAGCAARPAFDESDVIDLTYPFNSETVYWPTARRFTLTPVAQGFDDAGRWYASNDFGASEHGGTHLDAPIHFAPDTWAAADIPITRLMGPARALVQRRIDLVGLDTASLDHGPSTDFAAHRILNGANIPGLENVANLDRVPPKGATVVALPVKIEGGTGGPCRIIAILP